MVATQQYHRRTTTCHNHSDVTPHYMYQYSQFMNHDIYISTLTQLMVSEPMHTFTQQLKPHHTCCIMVTQTSRHVSQWLCKYTFSITRGQWYIYDNLLLLWQTIKSRRRQETSALHRREDTTHTTHHYDDVFIRADGRNPSNCAARATLVGNICSHIHRVVAYH